MSGHAGLPSLISPRLTGPRRARLSGHPCAQSQP